MKKLREDSAAPAIIVLTGKATVETAVEAMKNGAFDYLTKPYKLDELVILVNRAHEYGRLSVKNRLLEQELVRQETPVEFVGRSRQLREILALIRKVAPTDSPVLIQGESGTGKELVANTLWQHSRRCASPFIPLNCATLLGEPDRVRAVRPREGGVHQRRRRQARPGRGRGQGHALPRRDRRAAAGAAAEAAALSRRRRVPARRRDQGAERRRARDRRDEPRPARR